MNHFSLGSGAKKRKGELTNSNGDENCYNLGNVIWFRILKWRFKHTWGTSTIGMITYSIDMIWGHTSGALMISDCQGVITRH
jgi:hypothetical protein